MNITERVGHIENQLQILKRQIESNNIDNEKSNIKAVEDILTDMSIHHGSNSYDITTLENNRVLVTFNTNYTLIGKYLKDDWTVNCNVSNGKLQVTFKKK